MILIIHAVRYSFMYYWTIGVAAILLIALFIGVRYRQAYHRRKELERRGRIKKSPENEGLF